MTEVTSQGSSGNIVATDTAKNPKGKLKAKASNQTLLAANPGRVGFIVCNFSANEVWLALGTTAAAEEGIWLKKESGVIFIPGYKGIVSCITTSGEGNISYTEI